MVDSLLVPLANKLINDFGRRREVDLIHDFTRRYTFLVMSGLLGIPIDGEEHIIALSHALLPPLKRGLIANPHLRPTAVEEATRAASPSPAAGQLPPPLAGANSSTLDAVNRRRSASS